MRFPTADRALAAARAFMTAKERSTPEAFRAALDAMHLPVEEARRGVLAWQEQMNNSGRMSREVAEREARILLRYAGGHNARMRGFVAGWLDRVTAQTAESKARVAELRDALAKSSLGE